MHFAALPGIVTDGCMLVEALAMAHEAITLHLIGLREDGLEIPAEPPSRRCLTVRVAIETAA